MAEKTEVTVAVIKDKTYILQSDVVGLLLNVVPAMACMDDRQTIKQLAENIATGTVVEGAHP